jgi:hypothetical protein
MTLATHIAIIEPTPVREVFDACRRLIGGEQARYRHEDGFYAHERSQGLPALLHVVYGVDAPLTPQYPDEPGSEPPVDEWSIEVTFDTAYGYRAKNGADCADLHAWLVQELGRWLTGRGLTWYWHHEYAGEWHPSSDSVTLLGDPERGQLTKISARTD